MKYKRMFRYEGATGWAINHVGYVSRLTIGIVPYNFTVQTTFNILDDMLSEVQYNVLDRRPLMVM